MKWLLEITSRNRRQQEKKNGKHKRRYVMATECALNSASCCIKLKAEQFEIGTRRGTLVRVDNETNKKRSVCCWKGWRIQSVKGIRSTIQNQMNVARRLDLKAQGQTWRWKKRQHCILPTSSTLATQRHMYLQRYRLTHISVNSSRLQAVEK